jgi:hypothetical protein
MAATDQKKPNKKLLMAALCALLDKEGFLKVEEDITATSLYTVYKLIYDRCHIFLAILCSLYRLPLGPSSLFHHHPLHAQTLLILVYSFCSMHDSYYY